MKENEQMTDLSYSATPSTAPTGTTSIFQEMVNYMSENEYFKQKIDLLKIYVVNTLAPISTLQGASLIDGFLICSRNLAFTNRKCRKADLATVSVHECCHYFHRLESDDFNSSSPFKAFVVGEPLMVPRSDPEIPGQLLKLGRAVELELFDGIQPDWNSASKEAADFFLTKLRKNDSLPVISQNERESLSIKPRFAVSPAFGIEVDTSWSAFEIKSTDNQVINVILNEPFGSNRKRLGGSQRHMWFFLGLQPKKKPAQEKTNVICHNFNELPAEIMIKFAPETYNQLITVINSCASPYTSDQS